VAMIYLPGSPG